MLLTIEKVLILRSVSIFSNIPDDSLAGIAAIVREIECGDGEQIIARGDMGTSMFIIIEGAVKVHDGDTVIARLGARDVFGELAVLDPEPRNASVTAEGDTRLFELGRDALYELMTDHIEVPRGIIEVLCRRLRQSTHR